MRDYESIRGLWVGLIKFHYTWVVLEFLKIKPEAGCNVEEYQSIGSPAKCATFDFSSIVTAVKGKHPQN